MTEVMYLEVLDRDNLSEWLRRQTRNLLGFARASSNPAVVDFLSILYSILFHYILLQIFLLLFSFSSCFPILCRHHYLFSLFVLFIKQFI